MRALGEQAQAWTSSRRASFAGRSPPGAGPNDRLLRGRQDRARDRIRPGYRRRRVQRRERARARAHRRDRGRRARPRASRSGSIPTSTPGPTPRSPPARPKQVRHPVRRARAVYASGAGCPRSRSAASTCNRQPDHRHAALRRRLRQDRRLTGRSAPTARVDRLDLGGGLGRPLPLGTTAPSRPMPADYAEIVGAKRGGLGCDSASSPAGLSPPTPASCSPRVIYVKRGDGKTS